jgi:hypothetical protein
LQVEHHKKVICLVCNSVVTPYEAYHIDAGEYNCTSWLLAWLLAGLLVFSLC